jgi:hypothetical protein
VGAQPFILPEVRQVAPRFEVPAGSRVFVQGQQASKMCTLTTSCMLGHTPYRAEAVTESGVSARVLGSAEFDYSGHVDFEERSDRTEFKVEAEDLANG